MARVLLSGYYGFDNFGDEAILKILVYYLKKHKNDVTVITHNPDITEQQHNVKTVKMFSVLNIINAFQKTDVLISGGGSLLQDVTSVRSIFYYLFIIFLGILFCKKVIIFAQGIGPINNKTALKFTKFLLKKVDLITVRDERSKNLLKSWGINSTRVEDPVFGIKLKPSVPKKRIGIQLREWKNMPDDLFTNLVQVIAEEFSDYEIRIYSFQDRQDLEISQRFENYLHIINPSVKTKLFHNLAVAEMIKKMNGLEYLVAMRYHAVMIGVKYGIKTLAINYDPKVETLANFVKIPCINFDEGKAVNLYVEKMKSLSVRNILAEVNKKDFSFEIFNKEIKDIL